MGESAIFRKEDSVAIPVALALHVGVVALLVLQPVRDEIMPIPQRMTVSLASEVSLESTAPVPAPDSRAAIAPSISDTPGLTSENSSDSAVPQPPPLPPSATTRRTTTPPPSPNRDRSRPDRQPTQSANATASGGGSLIGEDFLEGRGSSRTADNTGAPAARFGRTEQAALSSAITRQLREHWDAPNGLEAELLVSIVRWQLNQDGSLKGSPRCQTVSSSITESNRPQASLHCDRAIRAVRRAAPFNLPEQFYSRWDDLEWQFDRRL